MKMIIINVFKGLCLGMKIKFPFYLFIILFIACIITPKLAYSQSPIIREWLDGKVQTVKTAGSVKANGLELHFKLPSSYVFKEGERPHVVAKYSASEDSLAPLVMILISKDKGYEEINTYLTGKEYADITVEQMAGETKLINSSDNLLIDGIKVFNVTLINSRAANTNLASTDLQMGMDIYTLFWGDYMVSIQFAVNQYEINYLQMESLLKKFKPFFNSVMNTFVLDSKWK